MNEENFFERPWGTFFNVLEGPGYKVKKITVKPGARLSLQSHVHRAEHWIVVHGDALVTLNDKELQLASGSYIYIPKGAIHRLENIGVDDLILVEVQLGPYLGEDDITRYLDDYNRI